MRMLWPSIQPSSWSAWRNTARQRGSSGSASASPISTPTLRSRLRDCPSAIADESAMALANKASTWRRLMRSPLQVTKLDVSALLNRNQVQRAKAWLHPLAARSPKISLWSSWLRLTALQINLKSRGGDREGMWVIVPNSMASMCSLEFRANPSGPPGLPPLPGLKYRRRCLTEKRMFNCRQSHVASKFLGDWGDNESRYSIHVECIPKWLDDRGAAKTKVALRARRVGCQTGETLDAATRAIKEQGSR